MAEYIRIIRLPSSIVAPGDDCPRYCIQRARFHSSIALVEVAWVLMEDRRVNSFSQQGAGCMIRQRRTVSLSISFDSPAICRKRVSILLNTARPATVKNDTGSTMARMLN